MLFFNKKDKKQKALEKELSLVIKKKSQFKEKAIKAEIAKWQAELKNKVPEKVVQGLELAFNKAFSIVFTKRCRGYCENLSSRRNRENIFYSETMRSNSEAVVRI